MVRGWSRSSLHGARSQSIAFARSFLRDGHARVTEPSLTNNEPDPQSAKRPSKGSLSRCFTESGRRDSNPRPSPWQREENRPSGPSNARTWCPVRRLVRLVRPARPFRIPVYHRTPPTKPAACHRAHGYDGVMDRITVNPRQMGGVPCIRGLRIPAATLVGMVADGMTPDEIVAELAPLELNDVSAALRFAAGAVADREIPLQPTA